MVQSTDGPDAGNEKARTRRAREEINMRCYNGCWDSEATTLFAKQDKLMAELRKVEPEAYCTYFPMEGQFMVHVFGKPLSDLNSSKLGALQEALTGANA
jgi:hypothetical protein